MKYLATGMASMMNVYGSMEMQTYGSTSLICLIICLIENQVCSLVMLLVYWMCE
jgi:hypothetical protein